jgi:hypothetical protein
VIRALDHGRHADDVRDADTPLERGNRLFGLDVVERYDAGAVELANVISLSTGTAIFTLTGAQISIGVFHSLKVTIEKCTLKSAQLADDQGIITVATSVIPMYDATNGVISVEVVTSTAGRAGLNRNVPPNPRKLALVGHWKQMGAQMSWPRLQQFLQFFRPTDQALQYAVVAHAVHGIDGVAAVQHDVLFPVEHLQVRVVAGLGCHLFDAFSPGRNEVCPHRPREEFLIRGFW